MNRHQFKVWREAMGFTQAEAAEALGISKPSVVNYESGKRREDNRAVEIPLAIGLACSALYHRIPSWEMTAKGKELCEAPGPAWENAIAEFLHETTK